LRQAIDCRKLKHILLCARSPACSPLLCFSPPRSPQTIGAASIAAGGIILMKREPRITMTKETLRISQTRVVVDYDFRNDSDADITTEVAFPIPAYEFPDESTNLLPNQMGFDDFKLWVDNASQNFAVETRSFVGKSEVTGLLKGLGIDAASFGHYSRGRSDVGYFSRDIDRLSPSQRTLLVGRGVISSESDRDPVWNANWRVEKKYHWTQIFPAHSVVQIRHQYTPVLARISHVAHGVSYLREVGF
jgi:hypothetical protein